MLTAILLAAGSSRRMGPINKLLMPYQGQPIVAVTATRLLAAGIKEIIVVTGYEAADIGKAIAHLPIHLAHNPRHEEGLTGSIQTGIRASTAPSAGVPTPTSQGYMICLADMVLITPPEYTLLANAFHQHHTADDRCILIPDYQGSPGNPVIFSAAWRDILLKHPEKEGCKGIIHSNPTHIFRIPMPSAHILADIDLPGDYEALANPT